VTGVLNNAIIIGKETTYGVAVVPTRGYEGQVDSFQREQESLQSVGFRAGIQAAQSAKRTQINMGGEGSLEIDLLTNGFGLIMQGMLGSIAGPVQEGATTAYTSTAATSVDDPNDFYTIQVKRVDMAGTVNTFTHKGCVITGWTIAQAVGEMLKVTNNFDFRDVDLVSTAGTPVYPTGNAFNWSQCVVTLDGVATPVMSMELSGDLGLKVDRRYLQGSALKSLPCRSTMPQFNGTVEMEYEDNVAYADFVAGNIIPITFTWTGANISGAFDETFKITLPACQFTGSSPEANISDTPKQNLPFDVLWNGTDDAVTFEYTSVDTAL